jgi:hypothetical protein
MRKDEDDPPISIPPFSGSNINLRKYAARKASDIPSVAADALRSFSLPGACCLAGLALAILLGQRCIQADSQGLLWRQRYWAQHREFSYLFHACQFEVGLD